jgi:Nuf2 family
MANFSFPELSAAEIARALEEECIAAVTTADLAKPSAELLCAIFSNLLAYMDPLRYRTTLPLSFLLNETRASMIHNPSFVHQK